jgi:hypothetical protein
MLNIAQIACNLSINYAEVAGTPILPFRIVLDTNLSILNPAPGQNQRFCYRITGIGLDNNDFRDLSHLVFGICNQIPASQITNISVVIDGEEQEVEFGQGGNVELRTELSPDPPTGCPGLKFDFGLDKVEGEMLICYELTVTYPIGPNLVCLFGGRVTRTGLSICGPVCNGDNNNCESTVYQRATVCVPVSVRPFVRTGPTVTHCCGEPIITPIDEPCDGVPNRACAFIITQRICVEVPVFFGANTRAGAPFVECGEVSNEDICTNCNGNGDEVL